MKLRNRNHRDLHDPTEAPQPVTLAPPLEPVEPATDPLDAPCACAHPLREHVRLAHADGRIEGLRCHAAHCRCAVFTPTEDGKSPTLASRASWMKRMGEPQF
jgi:hypothetical protein